MINLSTKQGPFSDQPRIIFLTKYQIYRFKFNGWKLSMPPAHHRSPAGGDLSQKSPALQSIHMPQGATRPSMVQNERSIHGLCG